MGEHPMDWLEQNMAMWDLKVPTHLNSVVYDVPGFVAGALSLKPHEISDLGDVQGKDLVHLQCHIGLDTLSWARLGANVTGLDFSAQSILAAQRIASQAQLEARFVTANVYDAATVLGRAYDVVYTGVGALCWLPDLSRWASVISELLRPGGLLYLFEFHPVEWMLDRAERGGVELKFDYFTPPDGYRAAGAVTYAELGAIDATQPTVQWNHPLGEVVTALVNAGLLIEELRELDRSILNNWPGMEASDDGMFRMVRNGPNLPLMYVLRARRPG